MFAPVVPFLARSRAWWGLARFGVSPAAPAVVAGERRGVASRPPTDTCVTSARAPAPPSFTVVPCSCCDEERVMEFMQRTFYREEPVLVAAGLSECPPQVCPQLLGTSPPRPGPDRTLLMLLLSARAPRADQALLEHTRASFREGLSLMAVLQGGSDGGPRDICGVAINSIVAPADACKLRQQAEQVDCPATRRVLELWSMMLERPEIWSGQDPEGSCMLELRELASDKAVRGLGVGLQLALAAREVAADVGACAYKIDCTSQYR
ncbi:Dopamine N-acetyltransferase [Frankliniella fusca]|uniref:Dopamine N-acetyltransferase n=1 Tax=Frankliniella fusca TaxID=407009 RepID=A0AAE1LQL8_9NEOP|nr:Dopamine N-acetyltransferase [Frankliniella fusca]